MRGQPYRPDLKKRYNKGPMKDYSEFMRAGTCTEISTSRARGCVPQTTTILIMRAPQQQKR